MLTKFNWEMRLWEARVLKDHIIYQILHYIVPITIALTLSLALSLYTIYFWWVAGAAVVGAAVVCAVSATATANE